MWIRFALLSFIISVTFAATNIALPYFLLYLKGSLHSIVAKFLPAERVVVEVGVLTSAYMVTRVIVAFSSGYIAERIGHKKSIYAGLTLYFLSGLMLLFANDFTEVLVARTLQGIASALVWPVAESLMVNLIKEKTKALTMYVMAMNMGFVLGPALGGSVLQAAASLPLDIAVRTPFVLLPLGALVGFPLMLKIPDVLHKERKKVRELATKIMSALYIYFFNGFVNGIASGILMSVIIVYIMQYVTSVPLELSLLLAGSGLLGAMFAMPLSKRIDRMDFKKRFKTFAITNLIHKVAFALIMFAKTYVGMFIVLTIVNFLTTLVLPLTRSTQSDIIPKEVTAKVFGIQQAMFNLGMIVGPLFGSFLYKWFASMHYDPGLVFPISSAIGLVGAVLYFFVRVDEIGDVHSSPGPSTASSAA